MLDVPKRYWVILPMRNAEGIRVVLIFARFRGNRVKHEGHFQLPVGIPSGSNVDGRGDRRLGLEARTLAKYQGL